MKKLPVILSAIVLTAHSTFAAEATLVQTSVSGGLPEGVDFQVKPQGYKYGATLSFFVKGQNLIGFDKKSLVAEGWEMGFWPKVSKDGQYGSFSISKKGDFVGKTEAVKVTGSIKAMTGSAPKTETKSLKNKQAMTMGPFTVTLDLDAKWSKGVKVEGDLTKIKELTVMSGKSKLRQGGWGGGSNSRTYNFKNIKEGDSVSIEYYTQTGSVTYTFKK